MPISMSMLIGMISGFAAMVMVAKGGIGVITLWLISLPIFYLVAFNFQGGPIRLRIGFLTGFVVAVVVDLN